MVNEEKRDGTLGGVAVGLATAGCGLAGVCKTSQRTESKKVGNYEEHVESKSGSQAGMVAGIAVVAVAIIAGITYLFSGSEKKEEEKKE